MRPTAIRSDQRIFGQVLAADCAYASRMTSRDMQQQYQARMQRVLGHIDAHLDGDLDVETLATVASFSPCHFQRQFTATFGMSVGRYVQLQRLRRASYELVFRSESVMDVALNHGYRTPEAFARAFRRTLGQSPSGFREAPDWPEWHATFGPLNERERPPMTDYALLLRIIDMPDLTVASLEHRGDPHTIGETVRRFIAWRRANRLPPSRSRTFNVFHTPIDLDPAEYRMELCASITQSIAPNDEGIVERTIPGGRVAVIRHVGPDSVMADAFHWLYSTWLPGSGEVPRDFPPFLERLSFFPEVPQREAEWQAFLPLADRQCQVLTETG